MAGAFLEGMIHPIPWLPAVPYGWLHLDTHQSHTTKGVHHGGVTRSRSQGTDWEHGFLTRPTPYNLCIRSPQNLRHSQDMCGLRLHCSPQHSRGCHQDCRHSLGCTCHRRCPTCGRWSLWMVCWQCMCFLWWRGVRAGRQEGGSRTGMVAPAPAGTC